MYSLLMNVFGGLAIFVFGMQLMSDGLHAIAGKKMQKILEFFSANRFVAILSGTVVTAVVQSSSATTVMVIGFINAGLLNLMQANNAFFEEMNRRIERDIIVQENRAVNCESVNIAKSVATAQKQLRAIEIIQNAGLLEKIGHELTESAKLRLENHSASLSELASMHEPPITKSTLNNRFAKIMQMAENIANRN